VEKEEEEEKKKRMRSRRRRRERSLWCGGRTHLLGGEGGHYFGRRQTQLCTLRKYFVPPKGIIIPLNPPSPHSWGLGAGGSGGEFSHPPPTPKNLASWGGAGDLWGLMTLRSSFTLERDLQIFTGIVIFCFSFRF
jgi:hypothetical protein